MTEDIYLLDDYELRAVGEVDHAKGSHFFVKYTDLPEGKHILYVHTRKRKEDKQCLGDAVGSDTYLKVQIL